MKVRSYKRDDLIISKESTLNNLINFVCNVIYNQNKVCDTQHHFFGNFIFIDIFFGEVLFNFNCINRLDK